MPLDSNGIWQYTESEAVAPFSNVLNRLAESVSDVIAPHVPNSSMVLTFSGGLSGNATFWVRGGVAGIALSAQIGTVSHDTVVGTVPAAYRPALTVTVPLAPNNASAPFSVFIQVSSTGVVTFLMYGGGGSATYIRGNGSWPTNI